MTRLATCLALILGSACGEREIRTIERLPGGLGATASSGQNGGAMGGGVAGAGGSCELCVTLPILSIPAEDDPSDGVALDNAGLPLGVCDAAASACPSLGEGRHGAGWCFDGVNDCIRVPWEPRFNTPGGFVAAVWFRPAKTSSGSIAAKFHGPFATSNYDSWQLFLSSAHVGFATWDKNFDFLESSQTLTENEWVHIASAWDGMKKSLYINGASVQVGDIAIAYDDGDIFLGCDQDLGGLSNFAAGCLDDILFFASPLDAAKIQGLQDLPAP